MEDACGKFAVDSQERGVLLGWKAAAVQRLWDKMK